ncbi:hypothetical protein Taro_030330, partial [Colocasia esculenta]|nr:hypothetical protein [Colocasia esculenta]
MLQALSQKMKKWSTSVDTRPGQVDTRDRSQRNKSTDFYIRSTLESLPRRPFDTELSQVDTRCLSQGTIMLSLGQCVDTPYEQVDTLRKPFDFKCNKLGHMKGECPENKKEKPKKFHKFKKPKAMVATWSDEDSSEKEEDEKFSSSDSEEICFMVNSSDGKARSTLPSSSVDTLSLRSTLTSSSVDTDPLPGSTRWPSSTFESGKHSTFFPPPTYPCPSSYIPSSPSSHIPLHLVSMAPKQAPRRGARSRATARSIPADDAPPIERRSKRCHDPAEQPGPSSVSASSAKRAHLTQVFKHFDVSLENEKSQKIPKSNIYCFKHVQKFMRFRIVGDQVRRGPAVVEAPVVQEDQPPVQEDQPPVQEDHPPANEDQPPVNEDQPPVADEVDVPLNAPLSPQLQPSSSLNPEIEIPSFSPQPQVQASTSFGGPSVPPELYTFLNDKFDALNTSIQTMT